MNYSNLFLAAVVLASSTSFAESTNDVYVTKSEILTIPQIDSYHACFYTAAVEAHESLPAKDFPEGNWGKPAYGLQVSLRLTKSAYTNREKIPVEVMIRNVTTNEVTFLYDNHGYADLIYLKVTTKTGEPVARPKPGPVVQNGLGETLQPHEQSKIQEFIKDYYLTNGEYLVHATVAVDYHLKIEPNGDRKVISDEATSSDVPFEIK